MNKLASRNPDAKEQNRELKRTCLRFTLRKFKVKSSLKSSRQQSVRPWARFQYYEMYTKVSLTLPIYNPIQSNSIRSPCPRAFATIFHENRGAGDQFPPFLQQILRGFAFFCGTTRNLSIYGNSINPPEMPFNQSNPISLSHSVQYEIVAYPCPSSTEYRAVPFMNESIAGG